MPRLGPHSRASLADALAQAGVILAEVARVRPELAAFFGCLYQRRCAPKKPSRCAAPT